MQPQILLILILQGYFKFLNFGHGKTSFEKLSLIGNNEAGISLQESGSKSLLSWQIGAQ